MPLAKSGHTRVGSKSITLVNSVEGSSPGNCLVAYILNGRPQHSARIGCWPSLTENRSNTRYLNRNQPSSWTDRS